MNKVIDHFMNPRNAGEIHDPDGIGIEDTNPWGIRILITLRVKDLHIQEIRFKTKGCVTAIASASALTELVRYRSLEEAGAVSSSDVSRLLGHVPDEKLHCCRLAVRALENAIRDYQSRRFHEPFLPVAHVEEARELVWTRF